MEPVNKLVLFVLAVIVVLLMFFIFPIMTNTASKAFAAFGIFGDSNVYIKELEAKVEGNTIELSWTVPEGKRDDIDDYTLQYIYMRDLIGNRGDEITGTFKEWTGSRPKGSRWILEVADSGWYVFRLAAFKDSTELVYEETKTRVLTEADKLCLKELDNSLRICEGITGNEPAADCYYDIVKRTPCLDKEGCLKICNMIWSPGTTKKGDCESMCREKWGS